MSEKDTDVTKNIDFINETIIDNINFTYISESKIHGFGLFANKNLDSGTILCFLDGQVMSWDHYDEIVIDYNKEPLKKEYLDDKEKGFL